MKKYELKIESLIDDGYGVVTFYSKGHHEESLFKKECLKELDPNWENDIRKINNLKEQSSVLWYAKIVGCFEDREYKGSTLLFKNYKPENKKGWFPVTVIDVG